MSDSFNDLPDDELTLALMNLGLYVSIRKENKKSLASAILKVDFPFWSGKWVLVAFITKKIKKYYVGVITSMSEGHTTVKFARRVKSTSTFIWPQTDNISEIETEDF
jgi:hypothetical protein